MVTGVSSSIVVTLSRNADNTAVTEHRIRKRTQNQNKLNKISRKKKKKKKRNDTKKKKDK